ncbi:MAG: hypothetical protein M0P35_10715, partial [Bacteroidales bacterium]|nr:hypothetical protein [Bacteroidales bacterium]
CAENKIGTFPYYYEQLFTFGRLGRDPRTRVISVCYLLLTNSSQDFEGGEWFDVEIENQEAEKEVLDNGYHLVQNISLKLKSDNIQLLNKFQVSIDKNNLQETKSINIMENSLAFDHAEFIYHALERIKNKIEYTDIVFNLLPTHFTLTELKNCYEILLGEKLLDANFRRKISKLVVRTDNFAERKGHRVSQLYTFNPSWRSYTLD